MPYAPDATDVANPPDTGVLAATAAAEFRTIKTYMAAVLLAAIGTKVTSGGALGTPLSGNLANCTGAASAAKWVTPRALAGNNVDGSAAVLFANKFVVQGTADAGLSGPQFLGALATGMVKNTTTTGVLSIATAGTDYVLPGGALGTPSSGTLTSCTGLPAAGVVGTAATLAVGGNTFLGPQAHSDQLVSREMLIDCGMTVLDKGNSGTTLQTLDYTAGSHQKITATGNFTIASSNWPPTGNLGVILLEAVNFGAFTVTWPTVSCIKPDGTVTASVATYLAANSGRTAFQSAGTDFIMLWSRDAGTTIYMKLV